MERLAATLVLSRAEESRVVGRLVWLARVHSVMLKQQLFSNFGEHISNEGRLGGGQGLGAEQSQLHVRGRGGVAACPEHTYFCKKKWLGATGCTKAS